MATGELVFNGINGSTGKYLLPPMTAHELTQVVLGQATDRQIPVAADDRA
jgi:hypothetical protein